MAEFDINYRRVKVNGIYLHIAEKGQGPLILFLHGFPELWYSWRHQIEALSSLGYHAVAPDLRGYGQSDAPGPIDSYTIFHIIGDLIALIDAIAPDQEKVFLVGHDWGAILAWNICLFRPDRVKALCNLSVPYRFHYNPDKDFLDEMREVYGDDYYIIRFQEPGKVEAEFKDIGTERVMRLILANRSPDPHDFALFDPSDKNKDLVDLPSWLSEKEAGYCISEFESTGFTGAVNFYRNLRRNFEMLTPWAGSKIQVPVKFVIGDLDLVYHMPGVKDYIDNGGFKEDVPLLEEVVVMEGVAHFTQQEKAEDVNKHIFTFFRNYT